VLFIVLEKETDYKFWGEFLCEKCGNEKRQDGGGGAGRRGWRGRHFFAGASNQISLMKWLYGIQPDEPGATASMPTLPKTAIPGGFSLVIGHFISEIADCTQQQKNAAPATPFSQRHRHRPASFRHCVCQH
jgi:hypothetical protein